MKKIVNNLGLIIMVIVILFLIYKWQKASMEKEMYKNNIHSKTDTVYVPKYIKINNPYPDKVNPEKVTIYKTDTIKVDSIIIQDKIVTTYVEDSMYSKFNIGYLTNFPNAEKLIQLSLTNKKLDLSLVTLDGKVIDKSYPLNLINYKYLYTDGNLSYKKKYVLNLSAAYYIRPLLNLHDMNIDLSVKTNKINYMGGVNIYYYPNYNPNIGITPILGIKYNF